MHKPQPPRTPFIRYILLVILIYIVYELSDNEGNISVVRFQGKRSIFSVWTGPGPDYNDENNDNTITYANNWTYVGNFATVQIIDLEAIYISPGIGKFENRLNHMQELTKRIGFRNATHYRSGTEAYPKCLVRAVIDLLQQHLDGGPFLLLEDDVEWHGQTEIHIPMDADAIYLGVSSNGGHYKKVKRDGPAKFEPYNDEWKRVINMLSGHAILFISRAYMEHVISILEPLLSLPPQHKDVIMSRTQIGFRIYAPRTRPLFYQSPKFGGQKNTNPRL